MRLAWRFCWQALMPISLFKTDREGPSVERLRDIKTCKQYSFRRSSGHPLNTRDPSRYGSTGTSPILISCTSTRFLITPALPPHELAEENASLTLCVL